MLIEKRVGGKDAAGQPVDQWVAVGELWVGIGSETGLGTLRSAGIRAALHGDVPLSIARYSFLVRFEVMREMGIDVGMRVVHDGLVFDIKGIARDLQDRDKAYMLTEQGGSTG